MDSRSSENSDELSNTTKIAILLMGGTGAGKSSFIAKVTGAPVKVGNSLQPCKSIVASVSPSLGGCPLYLADPQELGTATCSGFEYTFSSNQTVTLVDTPGFDDLERPDMEVLSAIVAYLDANPQLCIVGIIYMHRITDRRVTATSRMNLRMLQALCGEHFFQNIVLTTTMWDAAPSNLLEDLEHREAELNASGAFWAGMIEKGSRYARYFGTAASGKAVVGIGINKYDPPLLNVLLEMRDGRSLEDTSAGQILTAELRKREEKKRRELMDEAEEEKKEKDALLAQKMEKEVQLRNMEERARADGTRTHGLATSSRRMGGDSWLGSGQHDHTQGTERHERLTPSQHRRFFVHKGKRPGSLGGFFTR